MVKTDQLVSIIEERFLERNEVSRRFFGKESQRLAEACQRMSERFLEGGRLLAFGRGPYATDAQHVSVEFVHPVIVGKRALPALDLSPLFQDWLDAIVSPRDIVMGFGPPEGDPEITPVLQRAQDCGAMTFALPGPTGDYVFRAPTLDPFVHQEMMEVLYHTLWETVHVFFEHRELGLDPGDSGFLYPFLGQQKQDTDALRAQVATSVQAKAEDVELLREAVAHTQAELIATAARAIHDRLAKGGKLILFGNGGSATDANDLAFDCVSPPVGYRPVPAISLALEAANISAIANDVGAEVIFLRQLIAHSRALDVAIGISTSGGSRNIQIALEEARKRGLLTVALLGYDGGEIGRRGLVDFPLIVSSNYIPRIQEVQASVYHILRESLEVIARG